MSSRALILTLAALALLALALRVVRLEDRPPHTDEAVNAWILGRVLAGEPFAFDPRDRHGPLLPAAGFVVATILGRRSFAELDERTIRLGPAVVGAAATGLFMLGSGLIPNGVLASTAALWAVSPLPVYYARYAIHETLLVVATLGLLLTLVRATHASTLRTQLAWAAGAGLAAGTMLAAKLSAIIPLAAAAAAFMPFFRRGDLRRATLLAAAFAPAAALIVAFAYSWGFTRLAGLHDLVFGVDAPLARAAGQGHEKGLFYFLSVLGFGGAGVLFLIAAVAGGLVAWRRGGPIGRGLDVYAVVLVGVHSAIPYKTPWLALGLWLPLAGLAGWAIATFVTAAWQRAHLVRLAAVLGLAGGAAFTASADYHMVYAGPASEDNPLAYAHTSPDLRRIEGLVSRLPGTDPLIAVSLEDPWPLPFLLRYHDRVGFWQPGQDLPETASLVITTVDRAPTLGAPFAAWRPHYFTQRPGVMLVALENPIAEALASP